MRTTPWIAAAALVALAIAPPASAQEDADTAVPVSGASSTIAPGVTLESFDRWEDQGWIRGDAATIDLTAGANPEYLSPGVVAAAEPVRGQLDGVANAVLAFNADFFDINDTGGAEGVAIADGELVKSAAGGSSNVIGFDADGSASIQTIAFDGTATTDAGVLDLHGLNTTALPVGGIGVYDAAWGTANRARVVDGAPVTEVTIVDGVVTAVTNAPKEGAIAENALSLVGRNAGAQALAALEVGDEVAVEYAAVPEEDMPETAVSGRQILIEDGAIVDHADQARHPRTAVGVSEDGTELYVLTVDGRQAASGGYTLEETAEQLLAMGAHSALNLDGGGSSTLIARAPGTDDLVTVNSPSDGTERSVGNGLAFTVPAGDGEPAGFAVAPQAPFAPGAIEGADHDRVFPGLTRPLSVAAYDDAYGPADADPRFRTAPARLGWVDDDGVFHARSRSGTAEVTAKDGSASGSTELTVLGALAALEPSQRLLSLPDADSTAAFQVIGSDAQGFTAPIDPRDIDLDYDASLFAIEPDGRGGYTVAAAAGSGSGTVTITVGGISTALAVTVGLDETPVTDLSDGAQWIFSTARASGSMAPAPGYEGQNGLALTYDFTLSTATRAAYARPPALIPVEGQPQRFGMWIKAEGDGEWPSLHLKDANGTDVVLRGAHLTEPGWNRVEFDVPDGVNYPVSVHRFYVAETRPAALYHGAITISELVAYTAPDVDIPAETPRPDPLVAGDLDGADWTFAVMSDGQFTGENPDSAIVASVRRTLQEIKESDAEFLIINGDLVDECESDDLALAERILDEELGDDLEWVYVPGNHEAMGCSVADWSAVFGPAHQTFDRGGTRFITLDTSGLTIGKGGWEQILMLRNALDAAAADPDIDSVAVVAHVPPHDKSPQAASRLGDRLEAEVVEEWLTGFETGSGKEAVYIGAHAGYFDASRVDGVSYWVNGNSGKAPSTTPEEGGFIGWTEFGLGVSGEEWLAAQVRPRVDGLTVAAADLAPGQTVVVEAELAQGDTTMPVAYPMGVAWSGSNVYVSEHPPGPLNWLRYDAWFDPETRELRAWRSGTVELTATVNGVAATDTVTIARR